MSTLTEHLGYAATDKVAIIHVDDLGMCHAANQGGFEAIETGVATCGSVMTVAPWFAEAAAHARAHPELDLGVHLALNSEWEGYRWGPVAGASVVPSLVDEHGYLRRTTLEVIATADPTEVEIELRAQIDRALAAGIDVTHIDSHMGTLHFFQPFLEAYGRVAIDYDVPLFMPRVTADVLEAMGLLEAEPIFRAFIETMEAAGIPIVDAFDIDSLDFAPGEGVQHNRQRLEQLKPGVTFLVCHASRAGDELDAIAPDAHARELERAFYAGDDGREALAELGIETVGMRELRQLMRERR